MENGWVRLNRGILEHWIWKDKPFSEGQAWVDLILLANYEDKKIEHEGKIITCKRGDVNLSYTYLATRWKWNRKKVSKFIKLLESDEMVTTNVTTHRTIITIVNYGFFQNCVTTDGTTKRHTKSQPSTQPCPITNNINNNNNNINNILSVSVQPILDYLNEKAGRNFRNTSKNATLIKARLKEGFTEEDFRTVIDKKVDEWLLDDRMQQYLRPETLFGTKFESYLNQKGVKNGSRRSSDTGQNTENYKVDFDILN